MATGTLGISLTGLNAAQAGIRTAQHNISNVNTPGFRRQEVGYTSLTPDFTPKASYGTGVGVSTVRNLYSQFQDSQVLLNQTQLSRNEAFARQASQIDSLVSDPNSGLTSAMSTFFDSAQTVANDPTSNSARQVMLSSGRNLSARFNTLASTFNDIRVDSNREIASTVTRINTYSSQIAEMSGNILRAEAGAGQTANDLRDQRDQLVTELNKLINVTPVQQSDGAFNLFVGNGQPLVVGTRALTMTSEADPDPAKAGFNVPVLNLAGGVKLPMDAVTISGGSLGGLLAVRESVLIPAIRDLDALAFEFTTQFNALHSAGFDKSGGAGGNFFTDLSVLAPPPDYNGAAFSMSMDVGMYDPVTNQPDPNRIAASSSSAGSPGDNANALAMASLRAQPMAVFGGDTFFGAYTQLVSRTATQAAEADIGIAAFETMTRLSTEARQSISGVSLDEEAANLIRFQQAYQASAKAMQIASGLFNDLLGIMR